MQYNEVLVEFNIMTWWPSPLTCHWSDGRQQAVTDTTEAAQIVIIIDQHPLNDGDQVKEDHHNGDCEIMSTTEKAFNLS